MLMGACAPVLRAAEHITLANGFDLTCDHHVLVNGRVRIYAQAASANYMELSADSIQGVETVPDPPPVIDAAPVSSPVIAAPRHTEKLMPADLHQLLSQAGSEHNVDTDLLASLVKAESNGNAHAVSRAGARGLMQLMPATARELGVADSFEPAQNVRGGTAYFDGLLSRYHNNIALALAAYNAGPEAVDRYHGIPPYRETRAYVARVIHEFNRRVAARRSVATAAASGGMGAQ
jgi:soluble lytic murein transglycosylase-like protein